MDSPRARTVVVTGLGREETVRTVKRLAGARAIVAPMTDVEGALAIRDGHADYLIGVCQSGAGGALAMAVAFLGRDRCATLATMGRAPNPVEVARFVREGKVAFGMATDQVEPTVRLLLAELLGEAV